MYTNISVNISIYTDYLCALHDFFRCVFPVIMDQFISIVH